MCNVGWGEGGDVKVVKARSLAALFRPRPVGLGGRIPAELGNIAIVNNGKLSSPHDNFRAVVEVLVEGAAAAGMQISLVEHDLLNGRGDVVEAATEKVCAAGADAAVIGLLDQGVAQPSAMLGLALMERGIPTVLIGQGSGCRFSFEFSRRFAPCMGVVCLGVERDASYDEIGEATRAVREEVLQLLRHLKPVEGAHGADVRRDEYVELRSADRSGEYTALMAELGVGDGLPLVAPTEPRVREMLRAESVDGSEPLWAGLEPVSRGVTISDAATLAVAAGCAPRVCGVVVAALRAMIQPEFRLLQSAITTHPGGTFVYISGPAAGQLGFASGAGCLGPGWSTNATVGRAVALSYSVFLGSCAGGLDLSVQGSPAEFTYCCAENIAESPWPALGQEWFGAGVTCVAVGKCEGPHAVIDDLSSTPEGLLSTVAGCVSSLGSNNAYRPRAQVVVVLNPWHARLLAKNGWTKNDVSRYLFEAGRIDRSLLVDRGGHPNRPIWFGGLERVPVVERAEEFIVVVSGEKGPHSAVVRPWSLSRMVGICLETGEVRV